MQAFIVGVLIVCSFIVGSIHSRPESDTPMDDQDMEKCKKENSLTFDPDYTKSVDEQPENVKCFVKCVMLAHGMPSDSDESNGWLNKYAENMDNDKAAEVKSSVMKCKTMLTDSSCDAYAKVFFCVHAAFAAAEVK